VNFDRLSRFLKRLEICFEFPGSSCDYEYGEGCKEGVSVSLMEMVRTYMQTLDLVKKNKRIEWLVVEYWNESQRMINKGRFLLFFAFLLNLDC